MVWEWLIKKSWLDELGKLEPKTKFEKKALKEMKEANIVIYKEYKKIEKSYTEWRLAKENPNYSIEITNRIISLIKKERETYKKEDI